MTAIALFWTPEEIIVATDSKLFTGNDEPDPGPVCKIHQENAVFFTIFGFTKDEKNGVETETLIREACRGKGSLKDRLAVFQSMIEKPLLEVCQVEYDNNREYFNKYLKGNLVLEVFFFGVSEGKLEAYRRGYEVKLHGKRVKIRPVENADIPNPAFPGTNFEGHFSPGGDVQDDFVAQNPLEVVMADPAAAAKCFIESVIAAAPDYMGPPIDILSIRKSGAKWIQRKDNCPDIKPFKKPM